MTMTASPTVLDAYVACAEITRTEARNFYYGIRLLPTPKRNALCALYALARRIDDIGDGDLPLEEKRTALHRIRKNLGRLDDLHEPVYVAVADAVRRFPVPIGAFEELVAGVETDLSDVRIADFDELVVYCRRVAGSVGRLCLSIFGPAEADADLDTLSLYADQLGIALQQTNILRDIREDLGNDRIYLPADELERFGVRLSFDDRGNLDDPQGRLAAYIRFASGRAQDWYSLGWRLLPYLDWRSGASCRAMSGIYHHLLRRIAANPVLVYDRRLSLSAGEKAQVALASLAGART